jgi:3-phosphoshikimate 1-carboxyvinyltransferase
VSKLIVRPAARPLAGSVPVPSDKSIGHRALIFGALSSGPSRLSHFSYGEDNVSTLAAFRAMGVRIDDDAAGGLVVHGVGLDGLRAPPGPLDCGNSGTTLRLMCGLLAAQPFPSTLTGDASLSRRPMSRIARPLRARGAEVEGQAHPTRTGEITPPLRITGLMGGKRLQGLEYRLPTSSAQVKSCLLLSGLRASGPTVLVEPLLSRDHTERMMAGFGLPIDTAGTLVKLEPPESPNAIGAFDVELPGDLSAAAFILVAGALVYGSHVTTRQTGLNPTRTGILDLMRLLGSDVVAESHGDALGEPYGDVTARASRLHGGTVGGELALRAIDEIPIACALAARASGQTVFSDLEDLRVKESDRISAMVRTLRAFGVEVEEAEDGMTVLGRPDGKLEAARVESFGDHRIAMTAAVLGLLADGETIIDDVECISTSFPRFAGTLRALGADVEVKA